MPTIKPHIVDQMGLLTRLQKQADTDPSQMTELDHAMLKELEREEMLFLWAHQQRLDEDPNYVQED